MTDTIAATEATVCRILAEVLELQFVHPQDGFFEVGGDSVLAVQVVARAREAGLVFTVRDLFDYQTAETLAAMIGERPSAESDSASSAAPEKSPLLSFEDGEFGEFGDFDQTGGADSGTEAEWETIT
ncbi:phosphopantetheine-binding protein [Actinocrispum sp. NPDC049592]|uniref:phosphopantetheine-binding protein n=1 Tax=Actinocrispum sp. NPDC049592 TaxID=3154835 RepID=UPI00343AA69E